MKILLFKCTKCKEEQDISHFYMDKSKKSGVHTVCKSCTAARVKHKRLTNIEWHSAQKQKAADYRKTNPQQVRLAIKNATYKAKYGLDYARFLAKIASQNNSCKICDTTLVIEGRNCPEKAVVDHCHTTGKIRGVICHRCNVGLGNFKDNIDLLNKAQEYLSSESFF